MLNISLPYKKYLKLFVALFAAILSGVEIKAQVDAVHFSASFNQLKPYRIFFPQGYNVGDQRFPVIYYFHGNNGSHEMPFPEVADLVARNNAILVAWNGRSVEADKRPYNNGFHSNVNYQIQFKDYFLDLVAHIDSNYRTKADRANRAVIGHSMGGFMSYFLAGKYPHLISVAVSSKGSPEFFVGYPDNHTLIQHRHMFKNLLGVKVRFQNGTLGEELVHLNKEVHEAAAFQKGLSYNYKEYDSIHGLRFPQFKDAYEFVLEALKTPLPKPERWHHADMYPKFEVWGYEVSSNLNEPGFIDLNGVTSKGFSITTRKWLPDGPVIKGVTVNVKTAPIYKPNTVYRVSDYNASKGTSRVSDVKSDARGCISVSVDHQQHYFSVYEKNGVSDLRVVKYVTDNNNRFLSHNQASRLNLSILNSGGASLKKVKIALCTVVKGVVIENPVIEEKIIESGIVKLSTEAFNIKVTNPPPVHGGSPYIRFDVVITDERGNSWQDEIDVLPMYDVPEFTEIGIDDGDSEIFGSGNGNNIAEPGETIMVYQHSHRTKLYFDDPYIESERLHVDLQPDKWGDGYALSSLIKIAKDCPIGHKIRVLACYEVKEWKTIKRNVVWGVFTITVGKL